MKFFEYFRRYEIHLEEEVRILRGELAQARGEITRLNLAIMPLASPMGKVYADSMRPGLLPPPAPPSQIDTPNSWASIQAKRFRENAEADEKEAQAAKGA